MRLFRISPIAAAGLLALIGFNLSAIAWLAQIDAQDNTLQIMPIKWTPESRSAATQGQLTGKTENAYSETLARPVFFKDRRPFVSPPPPPPPRPVALVVAPPPVTNPGLGIAGIAITENGKQAFVTSATSKDGSWVREGEDVMGWRVARITGDSVTIQKAQQSIELPLYKNDAKE